MFKKIFSQPSCLFSQANTTSKRILCGVAGVTAAAGTMYGTWQGVVIGKHLIETKPLSPPKELTLAERKNRQLMNLVWQTPLAVTFSAGFSGWMLYQLKKTAPLGLRMFVVRRFAAILSAQQWDIHFVHRFTDYFFVVGFSH